MFSVHNLHEICREKARKDDRNLANAEYALQFVIYKACRHEAKPTQRTYSFLPKREREADIKDFLNKPPVQINLISKINLIIILIIVNKNSSSSGGDDGV